MVHGMKPHNDLYAAHTSQNHRFFAQLGFVREIIFGVFSFFKNFDIL